MSSVEVITLFITILCLVSFCIVFTILFRHYYNSNINLVSSGKEDIELIDNALDEEKKSKSRSRRVIRIIGRIFSYAVLALILACFVFSLVAKIKDDSMLFGNSSIVVIASGSMSERNNDYVKDNNLTNQFDTYDIIGITKYSSQDEVKLYDVVAYKNKNDVTIVHRIVEFHTNDDGSVSYLTMGDSNTSADNVASSQYSGYLSFDKIIGKYDGRRYKGIGVFVIFLQSPSGIVTIISVVYCLIMFDILSNKYKKAIIDRTNMLVKLIDYDLNSQSSDDVKSSYHEALWYKGNSYTFCDGAYLGKETKDGIERYLDDHMFFIKKENGINTLTVTNTKTNESKVYENVSDDDLADPSKFISESIEVLPNEVESINDEDEDE